MKEKKPKIRCSYTTDGGDNTDEWQVENWGTVVRGCRTGASYKPIYSRNCNTIQVYISVYCVIIFFFISGITISNAYIVFRCSRLYKLIMQYLSSYNKPVLESLKLKRHRIIMFYDKWTKINCWNRALYNKNLSDLYT